MTTLTRKTDNKGRVLLSPNFVNCQVVVEIDGDEVRIRKTKRKARKYSFREMIAQVTPENNPETLDDDPVGSELL
jgi:hypothetical protein